MTEMVVVQKIKPKPHNWSSNMYCSQTQMQPRFYHTKRLPRKDPLYEQNRPGGCELSSEEMHPWGASLNGSQVFCFRF